MNFDIKSVKSWANRHDVKVGDEGYFANDLFVLDDMVSMDDRGIIDVIYESRACCFGVQNNKEFSFFLPLEAVKEDKPKEKKYRPFKTYDELCDFLGIGFPIKDVYLSFRNKKTHHIYNEILIFISYNEEGELLTINRLSVQELFDDYELFRYGKWVPFGVESESD